MSIKYFEECVRKYSEILGVLNYDIRIIVKKLSDQYAIVDADTQNKCAEITVNTTTLKDSKYQMDKTALHEVLEIMLMDMRTDMNLFFSHSFVYSKTHDIIRRIENFKEAIV